MCKCGKRWSTPSRNAPPSKNPITAGSHGISPIDSDNSMAGESKDQKLAAIITPAAKPSIESRTFLLISLKKKTIAAPSAVIPQVKRVAKKVCIT